MLDIGLAGRWAICLVQARFGVKKGQTGGGPDAVVGRYFPEDGLEKVVLIESGRRATPEALSGPVGGGAVSIAICPLSVSVRITRRGRLGKCRFQPCRLHPPL